MSRRRRSRRTRRSPSCHLGADAAGVAEEDADAEPERDPYERCDTGKSQRVEDGVAQVKRPTEQKRHKALHGLYRSILNNMVTGVSVGFKRELDVIGVGFRASSTGSILELSVGYSHPIFMVLPEEVVITTESLKGQPPRIKLESSDKQLIGHIAAKIRSFRKPEPYKGKGVKFVGEVLRRKAGKSAGAK